jgi:hypothetical protein
MRALARWRFGVGRRRVAGSVFQALVEGQLVSNFSGATDKTARHITGLSLYNRVKLPMFQVARRIVAKLP